jgi:hypothetical protein
VFGGYDDHQSILFITEPILFPMGPARYGEALRHANLLICVFMASCCDGVYLNIRGI